MHTTVVAVGIDNRTAQLLTHEDCLVENFESNIPPLCRRLIEAPADALILGNKCGLHSEFVWSLRASKIDTPAIRIIDGPRNEGWSHECAGFLNCGGDDVLIGPPDPLEVSRSVYAVCHRTRIDRVERFEDPSGTSLEINLTKGVILRNGKLFPTKPFEEKLLFTLASDHKVVSRRVLNMELCGKSDPQSNCLEVFISRLRKQLGDAASLLKTHWGIGYELIGRVH